MKFFDRAEQAITDFLFSQATDARIIIEAASRAASNSALSRLLTQTSKTPHAKDLADWKRAIAAATDPDAPDWSMLASLHDNLMLDDHLASVIESRIAYTKRSAIKFVNDKKEENPELKELFERPWYEEMVELVVGGHRFNGRRLMEMYELNDDNELATVAEIPQPYFNTKLGIITKNPGESNGWNYRDGIYANNYVQIGKDDNLGMLTQMAPIVLAKKLSMGSMLDFIDKYGVPPLFITTDREDPERLETLYNAARKFKSNNFMVGRGGEKFEVGDVGTTSIAPMEALNLRADNMMSKRVLGGTGLTDEKGFVGSVGIQYKIAIDRFESDRLLWKHFFNTEIRPRLIKLSPVYKALETYKLDYDDTESLTQKEKIDVLLKMANYFELDPDEVSAITSIKVVGVKQQVQPPAPGDAEPKK